MVQRDCALRILCNYIIETAYCKKQNNNQESKF